jgi:hypothetical protein
VKLKNYFFPQRLLQDKIKVKFLYSFSKLAEQSLRTIMLLPTLHEWETAALRVEITLSHPPDGFYIEDGSQRRKIIRGLNNLCNNKIIEIFCANFYM